MASLADAGVEVVVLRGEVGLPNIDSDHAASRSSESASREANRTLQLLVRRAQRDLALGVLEPLGWRYSWVRGGLLRLLPMSYYWWDGGAEVELYWEPRGVSPTVHRARRAHSGTAANRHAGRRACQATRPGCTARPRGRPGLSPWPSSRGRLGQVQGGPWAIVDWTPVHALARRTGVSRALRSALAAADAGLDRPERGAAYDGLLEMAWRLASAFQARARPRRLKRLLAGTPWFGDAAIRCRVGSVEVIAGPGVFVPSPDADLFAEVAAEQLGGMEAPTVLEVGTGCGAIALALARDRPDAEVHGTELSNVAVRWAKRNARSLGLDRVGFSVGSLLDAIPAAMHGRVDFIIANLPYFPAREYMAIGSVPRDTIQGSGDDGLGLIRKLARDAIRSWHPVVACCSRCSIGSGKPCPSSLRHSGIVRDVRGRPAPLSSLPPRSTRPRPDRKLRQANQVPNESSLKERKDVALDLGRGIRDARSNPFDEVGDRPLTVDQLPYDEPDRVEPVVRPRIQVQEHRTFRLAELARHDAWVALDPGIAIHGHHCDRNAWIPASSRAQT